MVTYLASSINLVFSRAIVVIALKSKQKVNNFLAGGVIRVGLLKA